MKKTDTRESAARYYDSAPPPFDDIPFYRTRIPSHDAAVLELGCGTGRVLIPLAESCAFIHGVDVSKAMLDICREKMAQAGISSQEAAVDIADISKVNLNRTFDLIIAPYRVFQNLETDVQVDGFFDSVRRHLAPQGSCILNVFHPWPIEKIQEVWGSDQEHFSWEMPVEGGKVTCHERRHRFDADLVVLHIETIYREYVGDKLVDRGVMNISMRCYYPESFQKIVTDHGFTIMGSWGGYRGEPYGEGNELVIHFKDSG